MITRIVKMTFAPEYVDDFLNKYNERKHQIAAFDGCKGVTLLRDIDNACIFFTYSKWDTVEHLNAYRSSDLFVDTWNFVKILFADKPEAWSVKDVE
ncbi:MAG: antibiotic biosynthesis monooxygenase [Bacteroidetes bacterium]|nr:antibiotic biosynthesis monooxygenase [Bacteroidota bacterium]